MLVKVLALAILVSILLYMAYRRLRVWWLSKGTIAGMDDVPLVASGRCGSCRRVLTKENNSGWACFYKDNRGLMYSQYVCKECLAKDFSDGQPVPKAEDD
jgi:hypothetical protein